MQSKKLKMQDTKFPNIWRDLVQIQQEHILAPLDAM